MFVKNDLPPAKHSAPNSSKSCKRAWFLHRVGFCCGPSSLDTDSRDTGLKLRFLWALLHNWPVMVGAVTMGDGRMIKQLIQPCGIERVWRANPHQLIPSLSLEEPDSSRGWALVFDEPSQNGRFFYLPDFVRWFSHRWWWQRLMRGRPSNSAIWTYRELS